MDIGGLGIQWSGLWDPTHSLINSIIRGTIVYLGLYVMLRMMNNRRSGSIRLSDLLLITLVSSAVQNSMVGEGRSLTEGAVTSLTLFFWSYAVDWLAYRFTRLRWLVQSEPRQVIKDGRPVPEGLRKEMITEADLQAQLRLAGIHDMNEIDCAAIEANGELSVRTRPPGA